MSDQTLPLLCEDGQRAKALHLYQELYTLAHHPEYAVCIGQQAHLLHYADGRQIEMNFIKKPGDIYYVPRLGFSPEQWESGVIEFCHRSSDRHMERAVHLSLSSSGMMARTMRAPHQGEQVAIESIELAFLNVFSVLSLIPSYIIEQFGTFRDFELLLVGTNPDMAGITEPGQIQGQFRYPLFYDGLDHYILRYQSNDYHTRDHLNALRDYIQQSGIIQLSNNTSLGKGNA